MKQILRYLISVIFILPFILRAQDSLNSYIVLRSGDKLNGKVEIKSPVFDRKYLTLNDSIKYTLDKVEYFQNEDGYFRVYAKSGNNMLLKREKRGKVDLYSSYSVSHTPGAFTAAPGGAVSYSPGMVTTVRFDYYMKNNGIKELDYSNLKKDLSDNAESMRYLKSYNTLRYVQWGIFAAGAVMVISAFARMDKDEGLPKGLLIGGGVVMGASFIPSMAKDDRLRQAVEAYNEE